MRRCIALRMKSPPWIPLEDTIDRTTRGEWLAVVSTQMLPNYLSTDVARLTYSSSHMTLHHIEVVSLKSNLSVASVVSAKSFETGSSDKRSRKWTIALSSAAGSCTSSLRCAVKAVWRNVERPRVYRYPMSPWS